MDLKVLIAHCKDVVTTRRHRCQLEEEEGGREAELRKPARLPKDMDH